MKEENPNSSGVFDMEDVTSSLVEALHEVDEHLRGEKKRRSARDFLDEVKGEFID